MEYSLESAILYREVWSRYATFILRGLFCLRLHYTQEYSRRGLISAASPRALERTLILPFCLINILQCSKSWVLTNLEHVYRSEIRNDFNLKKKKKRLRYVCLLPRTVLEMEICIRNSQCNVVSDIDSFYTCEIPN